MVYTVVNTGSTRERDDDTPKPKGDGQQQAKSGVGFWNLDLELQAIKTILTPTSDWSTKVYSVCKADYFHHSTTKLIFSRVQSLMDSSQTYELPTLEFVLSDSKISPAIRQTILDTMEGDSTIAIVQSQGDYDILIQGLISLSKTRSLYKATKDAANELLDSTAPTDLIKQVSDRLGQSLFGMEGNDELLAQINMGLGYNQAAEDSFSRIINGSFEDSKIKTGFAEFDEKTGGFQKTNLVVVGANSGGGKCSHFDTLVATSQGIYQIGDLYNLFAKPDDKGWIAVPEGALQVFTREGIKDVDGIFKTEGSTYKVTTKWSDEFEGLGEHKLYCYDNSKQEFGFKRLDEIQVKNDWILKAVGTNLYGESVAIPYIPPTLEQNGNRYEDVSRYPEKLTNELATLFGLVVAEGHRAFSFTNTDPMLLDYVISSLRNHFGCERKVTRSGYAVNFNEILQHYFTHFLGDVKSAERFVPSCIMQAPEEFQCDFLQGLFEGDGCIYEVNKGGEKGKDSKVWSLELTTISHRLIYDVKALLENVGIYCKVEKKDTWASNGSENQVAKDGYHLFILRESYALFQEKIGFMSDRKKSELARCVDHCNKMTEDGNPNYFVSGLFNHIPDAPVVAYINRVFKLMEDQTITVTGVTHGKPMSYQAAVGKYHIFYPNLFIKRVLEETEGYTSKYTADLVINSHNGFSTRNRVTGENVPVAPHIQDLIENDSILKQLRSQINELCSQVWAQVTSFEQKDEVVPVFDLSVPGPHEYAANGLMSHNSLMAVNLLIRQYLLGYNTVLCSYEMTDDEVMVRLLSNIGEVDMNKLQNNNLTPPETMQATAAWREFNLKGYVNKNTYSIICPKTETTVPEIGFRVRSMKPDVLILDYINLLASSTGKAEAQWQQLGDISREAKLLANKLNCVVILLAQIDDAYNLRYSKAIKDHANFVMGWIRDDDSKNTRSITIHQMKARNAPVYDWVLGERFDIAQFRDEGQQDRTNWPTADELMMLELQCQTLGLKLEPTVSMEFDTKKRLEAKQLVNTNRTVEQTELREIDVDKVKQLAAVPVKTNLLFSADDAISIDFSKLEVKASSASLLGDNLLYEDTV